MLFNIGFMYEEGDGSVRDYKKAEEWCADWTEDCAKRAYSSLAPAGTHVRPFAVTAMLRTTWGSCIEVSADRVS